MPPDPTRLRHFRVLTYSKKFLDPSLCTSNLNPPSKRKTVGSSSCINCGLKSKVTSMDYFSLVRLISRFNIPPFSDHKEILKLLSLTVC